MNFLLGQELALYRGLGNYLLFAPRDSVISSNKILFPFEVRRTEKPIFLILKLFFLLGYLAIQLLGLSVGTIIISPFPSFFSIVDRKCSSISEEIVIQQPLAVITPIWISQHPDRQKKATELCSFAIIWWSFLNLFVFSR